MDSFWDDDKVVEMDGGDGCTTLWMCLRHWIAHLKVVKMVSFYVMHILP